MGLSDIFNRIGHGEQELASFKLAKRAGISMDDLDALNQEKQDQITQNQILRPLIVKMKEQAITAHRINADAQAQAKADVDALDEKKGRNIAAESDTEALEYGPQQPKNRTPEDHQQLGRRGRMEEQDNLTTSTTKVGQTQADEFMGDTAGREQDRKNKRESDEIKLRSDRERGKYVAKNEANRAAYLEAQKNRPAQIIADKERAASAKRTNEEWDFFVSTDEGAWIDDVFDGGPEGMRTLREQISKYQRAFGQDYDMWPRDLMSIIGILEDRSQ